MGCCISKCKPKTSPHVNPNLQDKLVISQLPPPPPSPPQIRKTVQSPPSVMPSSFTSSSETSTCDSSSSSSLSTQSSLFSNEFLQACAKEKYPQVVRLDSPIKRTVEAKQLVPRNAQKRARATSPTLTRQKSFRVEKERSLNTGVVNGRSVMRSPSPSRRFNGYTSTQCQRPPMLYSTNIRNENRDRLVKANTRPKSPNCNKIIDKDQRPMYLKDTKEIDMEDIDNPHIAFDCFIFL